MQKLLPYLTVIFLFISCDTKPKYNKDTQLAEQLTDQGSELIMQRVSLKSVDSFKKMQLNAVAIQKFDSAYHFDTTYLRSALLASECTFYGKDFQRCIYWLEKLISSDTLKHNIADHDQMIGFCYVNLGDLEKSENYFKKALDIWEKIAPANKSIITLNLTDISDQIYAGNNSNQKKDLNSKGIDPCRYSVRILDYLTTIDTSSDFKTKSLERQKNCR